MKSGSSNGGFSWPLFPWRYLRLFAQCCGTGTVLGMDLISTRKEGSGAVASQTSTTSGCLEICFSLATSDCCISFLFFFGRWDSPRSGSFAFSSPSSSLSSLSPMISFFCSSSSSTVPVSSSSGVSGVAITPNRASTPRNASSSPPLPSASFGMGSTTYSTCSCSSFVPSTSAGWRLRSKFVSLRAPSSVSTALSSPTSLLVLPPPSPRHLLRFFLSF